jgi:hypothetical protein
MLTRKASTARPRGDTEENIRHPDLDMDEMFSESDWEREDDPWTAQLMPIEPDPNYYRTYEGIF